MDDLRAIINKGLEEAVRLNPKMTPYGIAKQYGTNHPNLKDAIEGGRGFSDEMLTAMGNCPEFPLSYEQLKAIQLAEMLGKIPKPIVEEAIKVLKATNPQLAKDVEAKKKELRNK